MRNLPLPDLAQVEELYPYKTLFTPWQLRGLTVANRFSWSIPCEREPLVTPAAPTAGIIKFLETRAAAGLGIAFVGNLAAGSAADAILWHSLASALHRRGCRLAAGINLPLAPSGLRTGKLRELIGKTKTLAKKSDNYGIDALFLDLGPYTFGGWLLSQQEKNLTFRIKSARDYLCSLIAGVRENLPKDLPLFLACDPAALDPTALAKFVQSGADGFVCNAAGDDADAINEIVKLQAETKKSNLKTALGETPVFIAEPPVNSSVSLWEKHLADNDFTAVNLPTALIYEPSLPSLVYMGKAAAIQPSTATTNEPATLTLAEQILNPSAGASFADNMSLPQELPAATLSPDASSPPPIKRVAVIGAGLAGTHAALSALKAGHEVHLFDKHGHIAQKFYNQQVTALGLDEGANTISASETTQEDAGKEEDTAVSPPKSPQSPQELKVIAWHNYLQAVGEVFDKAEQQGVLHVLYESEATLAMLAEMRFDAIVVASGKPQSNADLYNTIKEAYITPVVRAAGALAGSTTITDCIRSGKLAGQNLFDGF